LEYGSRRIDRRWAERIRRMVARAAIWGLLGDAQDLRGLRQPQGGKPVLDDLPLADRGPSINAVVVENENHVAIAGFHVASEGSLRFCDGNQAVLTELASPDHAVDRRSLRGCSSPSEPSQR
jgi:hypothetical protein